MKRRYATLLPLLLCTEFALAETPHLLPPLRQNVTIPKGTPMRYQGMRKDMTNYAVLVGRMRLEGWLYADLLQDDGQAVWSITFKPTPAARANPISPMTITTRKSKLCCARRTATISPLPM